MKLSKREQVILIALAVVILLVSFYTFLLEPQLLKLDETKLALEQKTTEYSAFVSKMDPNNPIFHELTILDTEVLNSTAGYFPHLDQDKVITMLEKHFEAAGISPSSVAFTMPGAETPVAVESTPESPLPSPGVLENLILEYNGPEAADEDTSSSEDLPVAEAPATPAEVAPLAPEQTGSLYKMTLTINFESSYEQVQKLLKTFEGYSRRIVIERITSVKGGEELLNNTMVVALYAIPKIHPQDSDYDTWSFANPYGKDDPYSPFSGYTKAVAEPDAPVLSNNEKYDFFMNVNSIHSDQSTVMIAKAGDRSGDTAVYADNPGFEPVEIEFIEKNGLYYYRYTTTRESYPEDYTDYVEFEPLGKSINFSIVSKARGDQDDGSGVSISLLNKTKKTVIVSVRYDDTKKPRVKFNKKFGDVLVK